MISFFKKFDAPCKLDAIQQASVLCAAAAKVQPMEECVLPPHGRRSMVRMMLNVRGQKCYFLTFPPSYLRILLPPLHPNTAATC